MHDLNDTTWAQLRSLRLSTFAEVYFDLITSDDYANALPEDIGPDPRLVDT